MRAKRSCTRDNVCQSDRKILVCGENVFAMKLENGHVDTLWENQNTRVKNTLVNWSMAEVNLKYRLFGRNGNDVDFIIYQTQSQDGVKEMLQTLSVNM